MLMSQPPDPRSDEALIPPIWVPVMENSSVCSFTVTEKFVAMLPLKVQIRPVDSEGAAQLLKPCVACSVTVLDPLLSFTEPLTLVVPPFGQLTVSERSEE